MNIGLVGEVRCVVTKEDGTVKIDTGFQKNLILNQGLDFYGGGNGTDMFHRCLVGTGNSVPTPTQNRLDLPVGIAAGASFSVKYDYTPREDNLYLAEITYRYTFSSIGNVNISEVGLASNGTTTANAYMCTRALIKDASGNPTVISVLNTEKLQVYYKLTAVYSTLDVSHQIQYTGADNVTVDCNAIVRLSLAGSNDSPYSIALLAPFAPSNSNLARGQTYKGGLGGLTWGPSDANSVAESVDIDTYVLGSYKSTFRYNYNLSDSNGSTRCVKVLTTIGCWQVEYKQVINGKPITKTSKDTMVIPFEVSWGRYEGEL